MRDWDYPFYVNNITWDDIKNRLVRSAQSLGVVVDPTHCQDQTYLNDLHVIYENNTDGKSAWLDFHECIHRCEEKNEDWRSINQYLTIDYREFSGPLITNFDPGLLDQCTLDLHPGDVTVGWSELGKTPYRYWADNEPNDISRICGLVKPHVNFRPRLLISMDHFKIDFPHIEEFDQWWSQYQADWCDHWHVEPWTRSQMFGRIVIGRVQDFDRLCHLLHSGHHVTHVTL